jgi:SAM-dependent methyltransferase
MHPAVTQYVTALLDRFDLWGARDVLDLGGRDINGTTRYLWPRAGSYLSVDICAGPGVDVIADAATLDLDGTFDLVISTELLEHTPRGREIVATAYRHLVDGGWFVATMAGPGRAPHAATGEGEPPDGEWYSNVSPVDLEWWIESAGFDEWEIDVAGTDVRCWARRGET